MDSIDFTLAAVVIFFAYLVRGVSGFGSALVAVPLLVHFLPLTLVVPWMVVMDTLAALVLARSGQRGGHVRWAEIGWTRPRESRHNQRPWMTRNVTGRSHTGRKRRGRRRSAGRAASCTSSR
jgi:hypothetical protein